MHAAYGQMCHGVLKQPGFAPQISFDIRLMDQLLPSVAECDTIFAASSSEHVLLSKADVRPCPALYLSRACRMSPRLCRLTGERDCSLQCHVRSFDWSLTTRGCSECGATVI